MKVSQLTLTETQGLIESYQSQLKALSFQTAQLQKVLGDLEKHEVRKQKQKDRDDARAAKVAAKAEKVAIKVSAAPAKAVKAPAKPAAPRKKVDGRKNRKIVGGYRLGEWDTFLLETLKGENRALINSEILDIARDYNKGKGKDKLTEELLRRKLAAAMHKLANKRGAIVKTKFSGKGFAYALPDWTRAGKLKKEYAR